MSPDIPSKDKNTLLESYFRPIGFYDFYEAIFKTDNQVINYSLENKGMGKVKHLDELLDIAGSISGIFIRPASFFNDYVDSKTLKTLYAFVVDIDFISHEKLKYFIEHIFSRITIKPNFVVNSGNGIHLYYVLKEPLEVLKRYRKQVEDINKKIQDKFDYTLYKLDRHSIMQPFRVVSSLTKSGELVEAYLIHDKFTKIQELAKFTGVEPDIFKSDSIKPTSDKMKKSIDIKKTDVGVKPNAKKSFYYKMLERLEKEVKSGRRYLSLFALAIIAFKCNIPYDELNKDAHYLMKVWNKEGNNTHPFIESDIKKALAGYNTKAITVSRAKLEEFTGLIIPQAKRNGLSREEHIDKLANLKSEPYQLRIKEYLKAHPDANVSCIARALAMSRNTITKHLKIIKEGCSDH